MQTTQDRPQSQGQNRLPHADRRLLLAASFRLFLRRLAIGIPILRSDIVRLADFADEASA